MSKTFEKSKETKLFFWVLSVPLLTGGQPQEVALLYLDVYKSHAGFYL